MGSFQFPADPAAAYRLLDYAVGVARATGELPLRNVSLTIQDMSRGKLVVENGLFDAESLDFYTRRNLGKTYDPREEEALSSPGRGGALGDYGHRVLEKVEEVRRELRARPFGRRAVLTIPPFEGGSGGQRAYRDDDAKCLRELHFWVTKDMRLHCTGYMRAQVLGIFPKNAHMVGVLLNDLADAVDLKVGTYTHLVTQMTDSRSS